MNKLKPCPFCGNEDIEIVRVGTHRQSTIISCSNCGATVESNEVGEHIGSEWNYRKNEENLQELSQWLMGYVMELHDFRNKLTKKEYLNNIPDNMKDIIIGQFPMLQGHKNQRIFRELGKSDFSQNKVKDAVKFIKVNTK